MSTTPALDFVLLYVSHLEESLAYFTQTIGLRHNPAADTPIFRGFVSEEGSIPFGICLPPDETRRAGQVEVYFKTTDLDGMHDTLANKGVQTTAITHQPFGSIFTIDAPDGHVVTMLRPPAHLPTSK
jgi:Glyoxalase/Bleomycin resistance protein/Dioxygenase superfamily